MEQQVLSVTKRTEFKKGPAKKLRSEGMIPAIVYGHTDPLPIAVNAREFSKKFKVVTENTIITLKMGDQSMDVLVKAIDENIVKDEITHIDFYEFEKGKSLKTRVPVHLTGNSIGVKEGGSLEQKLNELEIECLPRDLPDAIQLDISHLAMGDSIHVKDIDALKGVKFLNMEEQTIVVVTAPKSEAAASDEDELEAEEGEAQE